MWCRSVGPLRNDLRSAAKQRKGNSFDATSIHPSLTHCADFMQNKQRKEISRPAGGLLFQLRRSTQPPCTAVDCGSQHSNNRKQRHTPASTLSIVGHSHVRRNDCFHTNNIDEGGSVDRACLECFARCSVWSAIPTRKVEHVNDPRAYFTLQYRTAQQALICV